MISLRFPGIYVSVSSKDASGVIEEDWFYFPACLCVFVLSASTSDKTLVHTPCSLLEKELHAILVPCRLSERGDPAHISPFFFVLLIYLNDSSQLCVPSFALDLFSFLLPALLLLDLMIDVMFSLALRFVCVCVWCCCNFGVCNVYLIPAPKLMIISRSVLCLYPWSCNTPLPSLWRIPRTHEFVAMFVCSPPRFPAASRMLYVIPQSSIDSFLFLCICVRDRSLSLSLSLSGWREWSQVESGTRLVVWGGETISCVSLNVQGLFPNPHANWVIHTQRLFVLIWSSNAACYQNFHIFFGNLGFRSLCSLYSPSPFSLGVSTGKGCVRVCVWSDSSFSFFDVMLNASCRSFVHKDQRMHKECMSACYAGCKKRSESTCFILRATHSIHDMWFPDNHEREEEGKNPLESRYFTDPTLIPDLLDADIHTESLFLSFLLFNHSLTLPEQERLECLDWLKPLPSASSVCPMISQIHFPNKASVRNDVNSKSKLTHVSSHSLLVLVLIAALLFPDASQLPSFCHPCPLAQQREMHVLGEGGRQSNDS